MNVNIIKVQKSVKFERIFRYLTKETGSVTQTKIDFIGSKLFSGDS